MKIKVYVSTKYIHSEVKDEIEIPDEELEDTDVRTREKVIEEYAEAWLWENISWGWEVPD